MPHERVHDVEAEREERHADEPLHHRVKPVRDVLGEDDGEQAQHQHEHDDRVPGGQQRREEHGAARRLVRGRDVGDGIDVVSAQSMP